MAGWVLGLSIVKNLVELHAGTVAASSSGKGLGASFHVRLPVAAVAAPTVAPKAPPPLPMGRRRLRTLFVEDNEYVREQIAWMLEQEGLDVVVCATGEQAEIEFNRSAFDVVVTDVSLPKMSGVDLARRLLAAHPRTWVVFASGYPMGDKLDQFGPRVRSLNKPFETVDLQRLLDEVHGNLEPSV